MTTARRALLAILVLVASYLILQIGHLLCANTANANLATARAGPRRLGSLARFFSGSSARQPSLRANWPRNIKMAWRSSGATNEALIENMFKHGLITEPRVKEAFLKVDRAHYAPSMPYEDSPQSIGHNATISAPHMHATAIESVLAYLVPTTASPAPRVLDIGSGSGYLTHVMAELVGDKGLVVGLEHIDALREMGEANMKKSQEGRALLSSGKVRFRRGDGRKGWTEPPREGEESEGKGWDVIHVGASAKEVHEPLLEQLKAPGCMFIPVDDDGDGYDQHVWRIVKDERGEVTRNQLFGVRYVPLTDAPRK